MKVGCILYISLLLTGCSSWWSSKPVIDNDGRWIISDSNVGPITAKTHFKQNELQKLLGNKVKIISGMGITNGKSSYFFYVTEPYDTNAILMKIIGIPNGNVKRIEIEQNKAIHEEIHIGSYFHQLYKQAITGNCRKIKNDEKGAILCDSPTSKHIYYIFNGQSDNFGLLLPPNDELISWKVSKIIWLAKVD